MRRLSLIVGVLLLVAPGAWAAPAEGYHARVSVTAPTRIDWTFVLATQSLTKVPDGWLPAGYDSTKQTYELFVPKRRDPKAPLPAIVFISPSAEPAGWKAFEKLCRSKGILFAGVRKAGNDCPPRERVRIVLDVLDDLRRSYPLDPDRTYLAGFSGGARMACAIGFALPEYFGGVIALAGGGDMREEPWLRHRVKDRLSVALVTGPNDFNHGELARLRGPYLSEVGVRTRVWVQPGLGHALPSPATLAQVYDWLEAGLKARQEVAKKFPAMRMQGGAAPDRAEQAEALVKEGKVKLEDKEGLYRGLMLLQGALKRWPDTPAGKEARKLLLEYEDKAEKLWEAQDVAEQRTFLVARAKALTSYVTGPLDKRYLKQRPEMAQQALEMWELIVKDGPDTPAGKEGKKLIEDLKKLVKE